MGDTRVKRRGLGKTDLEQTRGDNDNKDKTLLFSFWVKQRNAAKIRAMFCQSVMFGVFFVLFLRAGASVIRKCAKAERTPAASGNATHVNQTTLVGKYMIARSFFVEVPPRTFQQTYTFRGNFSSSHNFLGYNKEAQRHVPAEG